MGEIRRKLGQADLAEQTFHKALALLESLAVTSPADREVSLALAQTRSRMGDLQLRANRIDRAEPFFNEAEQGLEPLAAGPAPAPKPAHCWPGLFGARPSSCVVRVRLWPPGPSRFAPATCWSKFSRTIPGRPRLATTLPRPTTSWARWHASWASTQCERAYRRAYELLDTLVAEFPTVPAIAKPCRTYVTGWERWNTKPAAMPTVKSLEA